MKTKLPKVIIYDLDGVVVNSQERYIRSGGDEAIKKGDYNAFRQSLVEYNKNTDGDLIISKSVEILNNLRQTLEIEHMIALTARGEEGKEPTLAFLKQHLPWEVNETLLYMRPRHLEVAPGIFWKPGMPKFSSVDYKREVVKELMKSYNIVLAVDDHSYMCEMYWKLGIYAMCMMVPEVDHGTRETKGEVIQG